MSLEPEQQQQLDKRNASFWDELCGTQFARALGLTDRDSTTLCAYDGAYMDYYPYLSGYLDRFDLRDARVLEIGLGYGTLGGCLIARGADYYGLDISESPVEMMRHRLELSGVEVADAHVTCGSALDIPYPEGYFSYVYTIGCLHHTGNVEQAVAEVQRVLRPGGLAVVMLYNRHSLRQLLKADLSRLWKRRTAEGVRRLYDTNSDGEAAPHTDYVSRRQVSQLFGSFSSVEITAENFDDVIRRGRVVVSRSRILRSPLPRLLGLDLYIVAVK